MDIKEAKKLAKEIMKDKKRSKPENFGHKELVHDSPPPDRKDAQGKPKPPKGWKLKGGRWTPPGWKFDNDGWEEE